MNTVTVMPFLLAMFAAVAAMPTNVYQVCAWNAGTLKLAPWLTRTSGSLRCATQNIRAWLSALWTPRFAFACAAVLIAILIAHQGVAHDGLLLAVGPVAVTVKAKRARLLREATALRAEDGSFKDDVARATFDAKMAEIETIDAAQREQSETLVERNPLDPGAPIPSARTAGAIEEEPNERDAGAEDERARCQGILQACRAARLPQVFADRLISDGRALVDAQGDIFAEMGKRDNASSGPRAGSGPAANMNVGDDPLVHVRSGIENAVLHRVAPTWFKLEDHGRQYRGLTLLDTARIYLQAAGVRTTGLSKMELAGMALGINTRGGYHTSSDFANLLADVTNKTLRRAYEEAPQTFTKIARRVTLPDFKAVKRLQVGDAPQLLKVDEHGEFTRGTIGEGKEEFQLATYGRIFAITRKALVNDDTDAFSRIPMLFGRAARNLESNLVWLQVLSNPTMGDTVALFHATHANLSGTSDAIAVASIGAGRAAMRKQTGVDASTLLNINPAYLIVPPSKETLADQFVSTNLIASQSSSVNPFAGRLEVISEPRLEVGIGSQAGSAVSWYLGASPEQVDMIEYGSLEGEEGPMVESRVGFDVDGLEVKCRHDFAAKVIDWRGFYKNPGA